MDNNSKIMRRTISILLVFNLWISLSAANSYCLDKNDVQRLNNQIKRELEASIFYMAASHYFERSDMALHGVSKFFHKMSSEEKGHADKLMTYMNMRRSPPKTPNVTVCEDLTGNSLAGLCKKLTGTVPTSNKIDMLLKAMTMANDLEKAIFEKLQEIAKTTSDHELKYFIAHEFLEEQVKSIKQISDYETQLKKMGSGLGFYIFDQWF
ncbi:soma ferritin-like [Octopus sinensis]|uniref:Ferritin n=1 Tax=Octopus sinensis TaxID=2607531 RepID=A0A6P7T2J8_9MOLL|nr:soma ferritin-like [Octopus sinensis]